MKVSNSKLIKRIFQVLFFLYVFMIVLLKYLAEMGMEFPFNTADLHAICPFGAVESIGRLIFVQKFIPKIHESNFWVFWGSISGTVLFGALFCGWLCPLGSIQDLFNSLGKKIIKKRINIPVKLDRALGFLRYVLLVLIILQTTRHLSLVFTKVDPYYALFHFWTGEALVSSVIVLSIFLILSLFIERPWCRWFCPFGAIQGIIQFISPWKIRRNKQICINCNKCSKACPMKIDVAILNYVNDTRCNRCVECLDSCPVDNALEYKTCVGKGLPLKNSILTGILVISLFLSPVLIAKTSGQFKTSNKIIVKTNSLTADDIKGSFTIIELAEGYGIPVNELILYLNIPGEVESDNKLRDIEDFDESITLRVIRDKMMLWR